MDRALEAVGLLLMCGVRLGIPIALTLLLAWALRRLDAKWQAEAEAQAAMTQVKRMGVAQPRCWEMRNCTPERRARCLAYQHPQTPCWDLYRANGHMREECRNCHVFGRAVALAAS